MHEQIAKRMNVLLIISVITALLFLATAPVGLSYAAEDTVKQSSAGDKKENKDNDTDADNIAQNADSGNDGIIEENADITRGNASGDAVKTSGQMDFYTIRTANHQTYYLVIDHSGAVDNVYLLSTIDENDLQNFVDSGSARNGGLVVLPDSKSDQESSDGSSEEPDADADKNGSGKSDNRLGDITANQTAGIASLTVIAVAGIAGIIALARKRKKAKEEQEYVEENLEYTDGFKASSDDDDY